jgi:5-formyltetrahydrofolate cyclo-ligase
MAKVSMEIPIFAENSADMEKKELRAHIKALKKQHSKEQLMEQSEKILAKLELHPAFIKADRVMLYSALPDEVQTQAFLEKWHLKKQIILPTVVGDDIIPVEFGKDTAFAVGDFNILEPQNEPYKGGFDLIVVPGVAFDPKGNRLGRGRGYYDRFLCQHLDVKRIGICFDFQLVDEVPSEPFDIRMDEVITA